LFWLIHHSQIVGIFTLAPLLVEPVVSAVTCPFSVGNAQRVDAGHFDVGFDGATLRLPKEKAVLVELAQKIVVALPNTMPEPPVLPEQPLRLPRVPEGVTSPLYPVQMMACWLFPRAEPLGAPVN
jgi:hypothetical protein